jgi:hypothetical protein
MHPGFIAATESFKNTDPTQRNAKRSPTAGPVRSKNNTKRWLVNG